MKKTKLISALMLAAFVCFIFTSCGQTGKDMEPKSAEYDLQNIADSIETAEGFEPQIGIVLGSGLHSIADEVEVVQIIPYDEISVFPDSTVAGHEGQYILGYLEGVPVILMDGRVHYYEGYTMEEVVTPVRIMAKMGVKTVIFTDISKDGTLILTNASGSMREELAPGDLVCINDHISSFIPNPLIGQNDDELGERFVDMSEAYDPHLRSLAHEAAQELGIELKDGVYMQVTGPTYETPAEARAYASLGADIVGMSTVCETIVLRHMDVDVLGISCVTNYCPNVVSEGTSHEEVQEMADKAGGGMVKLVRLAVKKIGEERAAE